MEKNKNILVYIGIVICISVAITIGFILGKNMGNTPEENGSITKQNTSISKQEIEAYLTGFVKYWDLTKEFNKISDINDYDLFMFAYAVYKNDKYELDDKYNQYLQEYSVSGDKITEIASKYFAIKDFKYNIPTDIKYIKYDEEKNIYTIDSQQGIKKSYSNKVVINELLNSKEGIIVNFKVASSSANYAGDYTMLLNEKGDTIISLKEIEDSRYEKVKYETYNETDKYGNEFEYLKVNGKIVASTSFGLSIEQFKDLLIINGWDSASWEGIKFIDKNGNTVGSIGYENEPSLSVKGKSLDVRNSKIVDGNDIIITTTDMLAIDPYGACTTINEYKDKKNEPVQYQTKITYLGNGKFSEPTILKTVSFADYIKNDSMYNLDCSKY